MSASQHLWVAIDLLRLRADGVADADDPWHPFRVEALGGELEQGIVITRRGARVKVFAERVAAGLIKVVAVEDDEYADFLDRALEHELEVVCAGAVRVARPHAFVAAFVAAQVRCVVDEARTAHIVARGAGAHESGQAWGG